MRHTIPLASYALLASAARLSLESKHGLAVTGELSGRDARLLTSPESPITWYFNWSPAQSRVIGDAAIFIPLIHGLDTLEEEFLWSTLDDLPESSTHLFAFNEPDEEGENGGSGIDPEDAAEAYIEYLVPLRDRRGRTWNISHPAVTGSERGLEWLRDFNESCWDINPDEGCPSDFVNVHYYGDFIGLSWWIDQLHQFYNPGLDDDDDDIQGLWITEMAVPQGDFETNTAMLRESMEYMDNLTYVDGYAWFGAFREEEANEWTGEGVSLLDDDGDLTEVGREYLGGDTEDFPFEEPTEEEEEDDAGLPGGGNGGGDDGGDDEGGCNVLQPNGAAALLFVIGMVVWVVG